MTLPSSAYRDPVDIMDRLREVERKTNNCGACEYDGGVFWGLQACRKGHGPDSDGYCRHWRPKGGRE